jgi:hypothetical protein
LCARHGICRKHGNDATTHHHHDEQHDIEGKAQPAVHGHIDRAGHREVEREIRHAERGDQGNEEVVTAVPAFPQRHRDANGSSRGKGGIGHRRQDGPRRQRQNPRRDPQAGDDHEQAARRRGLVGPVAHRGEQKAHDHRKRVAEDHLVRVRERPGDVGARPGPAR